MTKKCFQDCLLTAVGGERAVYSDEKSLPVRFYENLCVKPPIEGKHDQ